MTSISGPEGQIDLNFGGTRDHKPTYQMSSKWRWPCKVFIDFTRNTSKVMWCMFIFPVIKVCQLGDGGNCYIVADGSNINYFLYQAFTHIKCV